MPVTCNIDLAAGLVFTTISGHVDTDELVRALEGCVGHRDFRPGLNGIADLRRARYDARSEDIKRLAELMAMHRDRIGSSRTAIVVSSDVAYGLSRMYQAFADDTSIQTRIFRDIDEAERWAAH